MGMDLLTRIGERASKWFERASEFCNARVAELDAPSIGNVFLEYSRDPPRTETSVLASGECFLYAELGSVFEYLAHPLNKAERVRRASLPLSWD